MTYNPITENLSFNYQDDAIIANTTLTTWGRQLYDVIAIDGDVVITLPDNPLGASLIESGSIFFRRLDTSTVNTVTVVAVINGNQKFIDIPIGTEVVHWFISVFDGSFGSTSFYFQLNSPFLLGGDVTSNRPVGGISQVNVDSVGGKTANQIATSVTATQGATATNTASTLVSRDSSGNTAVNQLTLESAATLPNQAARFSQLPVLPSFNALNVYVSGSGSDTNVGSIVSPFSTITKAETMVTGSGNIWIQNGSYSDNITITKDNVGWTSTSNSNAYKCVVTGTVSITGTSTRRAFKGIQFSTGNNRCIEHTSSKGILNLENCAFSSTHPSPLALGGSVSSNTFNYITSCDFTGMSGSIILADNNNNAVALNCVTGSNIVYISSGTLTVGTFITGDAVQGGTLVLAALGGNSYLISNYATLSGTLAFYNAVVWYVTGCSGLKLDVGMGHLVLGYNNAAVTVSGSTKNYLETSRPLVTVVSSQSAMLSQTYATFGGLGCMTKVTSDSTEANNGLWQCIGYTISSLSSWLKLSGTGTSYTAGTGLTLTGSTFSISPQTASRAIVSDSSGNLTSSTVTSTTLGYLDATSSVQAQINSKASAAQVDKSVKVVATSAITLSGLQTIDGVGVTAGEQVLVAPPTPSVSNGIWTVSSGAWTRSTQMPTGSDAARAKVFVEQGTLNYGTIWSANINTATVGTSTLFFLKVQNPDFLGLYTNLTSPVSTGNTTLPVVSTAGFPNYGLLKIRSEVIFYTGKTSTSFTGCTRAYNGSSATSAPADSYVQFLSEEMPYLKMGADFTVSTNPQRVYRSHMWFSGGATAVRTWTPVQIPWVYADITAAELACVYWIQQLVIFFKDMENDNQYDQLIGILPSAIVSRITGNYQVPDGSTDMDNNIILQDTGAVYSSEWFELIVGRNQAGTELYTMSFTLALQATVAYSNSSLYPFKIIFQTTRGASMAGFTGQAISSISGTQPRCTTYGTGGVTIPSGGFPIWAMPVSIETTF